MKKLLTAITLLSSLYTYAQDEEKILDPVSITASIQAKPVSQTGRNIVTYKMSDFANAPAHSLDELLRYLPGLEIQMRGPIGAQSDIVLRGGTFQQVLVLIDGIRVNDPNTGHFSSYIPISPAEIDRIEVLKGASSAIYGSDAVGGVIHVITKTFAARQNQNIAQAQLQVTGGEYGLFGLNAGGFYQKGNTAVSAGFLSNNTDGQLQRGIRGYAHNNTASVSVSHFINEHWQVSLRGAWDKRDFAAQNFYTTFASDTAAEQVRTSWAQAGISYTGTAHRVKLDLGYKDVQDDYLYNKVSLPNNNKSKMLQSTLIDEWKLSRNTGLISGVQFIQKNIRSNDRGDHDVPQGGVFVLLNQSFDNGFTLNPALRLDWNERSGAELVPQLSVSYNKNRFNLRGSVGKTIRDADFTERFNNYNKPIVTSGRIGFPDLQPERSFSYEAGADYLTKNGVKIGGTFFQRYHRDLIDYVTTPYADMPRKDNLAPNGTYALAKNISRVTTTGAELDLQVQRKLARGAVYAGAGLIWLDSKSSNATPSFYISSHANFMGNFFASLRYGKILLSVNGIYKNRTAQTAAAIHANVTKEYFMLNAKTAIYLWKGKMNIFAQLDNVTDVEYSDLLGAIMPGRWFMAGFNCALSRNKK